jgi:Ca2+-binding RTX toxin-like protein
VLAEALEPRRLLAFAAAEYFPLAGGNTWDYAGVVNDQSASSRVTSIRENGITRFDLSLLPPASSAAPVLGSSRFTVDGAGLKLHHIDAVNADAKASGDVTFSPGIYILNAAANIGDVTHVNEIDAEISVHSRIWGRINGKGSGDGAARFVGVERVNLPDGRFIDALKVTVDVDFKAYTGRWSLSGLTRFTCWLGRGIGIVKIDQTSWFKASWKTYDVTEHASVTAAGTITTSPLIASDTATLTGGVLTVNGTDAADAIALDARDGQVIATRGGVSKSFSDAATTTIDVFAYDGNDLVTIGTGVRGTYVDAGPGNDLVMGGDGADTLTGGAGKDFVNGGAGDDRVAGNGGHDHLIGAAGNDRLYGGNENDLLEGGAGVDRLWAGPGDDVLAGNGSSDKLFGEAGNDILAGGTQADLLDGGDGIDTFAVFDHAADTADGGAGVDLLASSDPDDIIVNL